MINTEKEIQKLIDDKYIKNGWFNGDIKDLLFKDADKKIIKCIERAVKPTKLATEEKIKSIFRPFSLFPIQETKFVVMGQAPYPENEERITGLLFLFDTDKNQKTDELMKNIFTLSNQLDNKTSFELWTPNTTRCVRTNKILFLNTALTFESAENAQNHNESWKPFIDKILSEVINLKKESGEASSFLWIKHQQNVLLQKIS